jgi:DinB superfamily
MANTNAEGYFKNYTSLVIEQNLATAFIQQAKTLHTFYEVINEEKSKYAYAPNKWTLKEMLQHLIDTERIFAYRALAIARGETATLPGYDEDLYATNSNANNRTWASLTAEMQAVRATTIMLYESFSNDNLTTIGKFGNNSANANTIGFIIIGHVIHHLNVAKELYLIAI